LDLGDGQGKREGKSEGKGHGGKTSGSYVPQSHSVAATAHAERTHSSQGDSPSDLPSESHPNSHSHADDHGAVADNAHASAGHATAPSKAKSKKESHPPGHKASSQAAGKSKHGSEGLTPDLALARLKEGNSRFVSGQPGHPRQDDGRRGETGKSQQPFAIIVGCADSRVPPEIIFDQGIGDLFVIRSAGQVLEYPGLASIEYAISHLGSKLIVVLGHERCGAVGAARQIHLGGKAALEGVEGQLRPLVEAILPAVSSIKELRGENLTPAVEANAHRVADQIRGCWPVIAPRVHAKELVVVSAVYDLDTGKIRFLE
jgi:carbonic anhydrase